MFVLSVFIHRPDNTTELLSRVFQDEETGIATEAFEFYARQPYHTVSLDLVHNQDIVTWLQAVQAPPEVMSPVAYDRNLLPVPLLTRDEEA